MLETEFKYFLDHQKELVKKYYDKYVIIKGNKIIGAHDTLVDAYFKTQKQGHKLRTFLIHPCLKVGEKSYITILQMDKDWRGTFDNVMKENYPDGEKTSDETYLKIQRRLREKNIKKYRKARSNIIETGNPTDGKLTASIQVK